MKKSALALLVLILGLSSFAQTPQGMGAGRMGGGQNFNIGHFYGKIIDSKTGKGVDGASLQLMGNKFDTVRKKMAPATLKAQITESNGDFSLENLPLMGNFTLKISAVGYKAIEQKLSFGIKPPQGGMGGEGAREQMLSMVDKDLGNIKLDPDVAILNNVTVTATRQLFEMGVDRKVFNVDRNLTSAGQTATEVMKTIPSISVDIDGNVTMRNSTPQLFVDGRPTTLTLDQIPADLIDKVELITNPSAKFDASGGNAGILNIVLKKNKKTGYNGGIRVGVDSRGKINGGGDLNFRQNKLNFFVAGMYNQRKSISTSTTDRENFNNGIPIGSILQQSNPVNEGSFRFLRGGFDYLIDNRNTISVAGNFGRGQFKSKDEQRIDSLMLSKYRFNRVNQNSESNFRNNGAQLSYKHNFAKSGHEWTGDLNYNYSKNDSRNNINTQSYKSLFEFNSPLISQLSETGGTTKNTTIQTDYTNPITDNQKLEIGGRLAVREFENTNYQYLLNPGTGSYVLSRSLSNNYSYTDKVYAAYANYSIKVKKWSYQLGLRVESSTYRGSIVNQQKVDTTQNFSVDFPLALFPSAFVTYKLSDKEDLQLNYSRRINRPNFFQLMPFIDFSDPYNLSMGNATLKPEFTNSFEIAYNNSYKKGANFLVNAYYKHNTNLITRYIDSIPNPDTAKLYQNSDSVWVNTYINANNSETYGIELTNRMPLTKWWDMTANLNIFNSKINVSDPKLATLSNQRTSWFAKLNNNIKFMRTWSVQLSGEYYARTVLPQEGGRMGGGRGGGGGMFFGGGAQGTAQGYINPRYTFDIAVRKDWTWKGGNSASLTLSMNDFLRTQLYSTYNESPSFIQTIERRRDPQVLRLNFSYRFGKFDVNLFKRKNTKDSMNGAGDIMMGGGQ